MACAWLSGSSTSPVLRIPQSLGLCFPPGKFEGRKPAVPSSESYLVPKEEAGEKRCTPFVGRKGPAPVLVVSKSVSAFSLWSFALSF